MSDIEKRKFSLSLVIPFTSDLQGREKIVQSYLDSESVNKIRIQFVFLSNTKSPPSGLEFTNITSYETHEIVNVGNDRFFSSAEENIYRIRDFIDVLSPWVLIIGNTDEVYWGNMVSALEISQNSHLDALLLNLEDRQPKSESGYFSQFCAHKLNDPVLQNSIVEHLIDGQMIGSDVAYPAILSMYGPIDWLAFIGSHIFSRLALQGILKYRFIEHVYSFVYMQLQYFTERPRNYRLFMSPVVTRISNYYSGNELGKAPNWEYIQKNRTVNGHSSVVWVTNFYHLLQIEKDDLFNVIVGSLSLAHVPTGNDEIGLMRLPLLRLLFSWGIQIIDDKFIGHSFYFSEVNGARRLDHDIWIFTRFITRMLKISDTTDKYIDQVFIEKLRDTVVLLNNYFAVDDHPLAILQRVRIALTMLLGTLTDEIIRDFHSTTFRIYCNRVN